MNRILLPIDGSEHSRKAIAKASELARLSGGEVRVFHLQERELTRSGGVMSLEIPAEVKELVNGAVAELKSAGISASGETRAGQHGEAAKAIVSEADDFGADLIGIQVTGLRVCLTSWLLDWQDRRLVTARMLYLIPRRHPHRRRPGSARHRRRDPRRAAAGCAAAARPGR
jgi:hypothetical protein